MTLSELKGLCSYWLDDLQFGYFTEAQLTYWLNNAQYELAYRLINAGQNYYTKCVETSIVADQEDYVLPTDFKKLHRLRRVDGSGSSETTVAMLPVTLNERNLSATLQGSPTAYTIVKNRLRVLPTPSASSGKLRMDYTYRVTEMVNDTDTPDAPEDYHEYIAVLATKNGFIKDGRASDLLLEKEKTYQALIKADMNERNQDYGRTIIQTALQTDDDAGEFYY